MFYLDQQTADLIAARIVRAALLGVPSHHYLSVEATVEALRQGNRIDERVAHYVRLNADRFCMLPEPRLIEPVWYIEANQAEAEYAGGARA